MPPALAGRVQLGFSGAFTGTMLEGTVTCGQNIPEDGGGVMQVTGTVAGAVRQVQIWSAGPAPGTVRYIQLWKGTPASGGIIDYQVSPVSGGISRFDWAGIANVDVTLTDFTNAGRPPERIAGTIVCPPTPTPAPAPTRPEPVFTGPTQVTFSGAISGVLQNPRVNCQQHIPDSDGGFMSVTGTIDGQQRVISIWSKGPAPGILGDMYEGQVAGQIDYGQTGADGPIDLSGITGFDWAKGTTFNIDLPYTGWAGKQSQAPNPLPPGIHVSGQIVC